MDDRGASTPRGPRIRPADPDDAEAANRLFHQLGYPQDDTAATAARIRAWADDPDGAAYAAVTGDGVVGLVAVHVCPFFERTGSWARIVALVVDDRARRQGIASALLARAEGFAVGRGCLRLEVTSANRRDDAHKFYLGVGFADQTGTSTRFLRDLPG